VDLCAGGLMGDGPHEAGQLTTHIPHMLRCNNSQFPVR
jgi:hypothetical protein